MIDFLEVSAEAEELAPRAHDFAAALNEQFEGVMGGKKLAGSADVYMEGAIPEAVVLLGIPPHMALLKPEVLELDPMECLSLVLAVVEGSDRASEGEVRAPSTH